MIPLPLSRRSAVHGTGAPPADITLHAARCASVEALPLGSATTWTPTGTRDALSSPLGAYLVHPSASAAAAHCARHPGARLLSSTEPLTLADCRALGYA